MERLATPPQEVLSNSGLIGIAKALDSTCSRIQVYDPRNNLTQIRYDFILPYDSQPDSDKPFQLPYFRVTEDGEAAFQSASSSSEVVMKKVVQVEGERDFVEVVYEGGKKRLIIDRKGESFPSRLMYEYDRFGSRAAEALYGTSRAFYRSRTHQGLIKEGVTIEFPTDEENGRSQAVLKLDTMGERVMFGYKRMDRAVKWELILENLRRFNSSYGLVTIGADFEGEPARLDISSDKSATLHSANSYQRLSVEYWPSEGNVVKKEVVS